MVVNFRCDICGKCFAVRQYLLNHVARHRNVAGETSTEEESSSATVKLPSADETAEGLAIGHNLVQIVELQEGDESAEELHPEQRNSFVQIVALKDEQNEACV